LLSKIAHDLKGNNRYYLDVKSSCQENGKYKFEKIASLLEEDFNNQLKNNESNDVFEKINTIFFTRTWKKILT